MFKEIGQMANMMKNLPKLQAQMEEFKKNVGNILADGSSGGGMVHVQANGASQIVKLSISEEAMKLNDKEMLEDLIMAATNQALEKVREAVNTETQKMAASMGLPSGMGLPGLG